MSAPAGRCCIRVSCKRTSVVYLGWERYSPDMSTHNFELVPGLFTTRKEVAKAYGGAIYGGIEPAVASKMVFVYSDPVAGAKHGYTFDGLAEDDEQGVLYLYTGEGPGDQKLTGGNASLYKAQEQGRAVHLFVADGFVVNQVTGKKTAEKRQRYVGQMVLDDAQPFEKMRAAGPDGNQRDVIVFRLRPDPKAKYSARFLPSDAIAPAPKTEQEELKIELGETPSNPTSSQVDTEEHNTDETVANIVGGQQAVIRREGQLTKAYKEFLVSHGHVVKRFQITVEGVAGALKTDLYDVTDNVLYEAKGTKRRNDVRLAIGQLLDYRRHIKTPPGLRLAVLLPGDPGSDLRNLLKQENIALVIRTADGFDGFPLLS